VAWLESARDSGVDSYYKIISKPIFDQYEKAIAAIDAHHDVSCIHAQQVRRHVARMYEKLIRGLRIASTKRGSMKSERVREIDESLRECIQSLEARIADLKRAIADP
jgi:hypothetical protein